MGFSIPKTTQDAAMSTEPAREYVREIATQRRQRGKCKSCGDDADHGTTRCAPCKARRQR